MYAINRSVEVSRGVLDRDDIRQLNSVKSSGYMRAVISGLSGFIFYIIAESNDVGLWAEALILFFGCLAGVISIYGAISSKRDLSNGETTVTKGYIWDVVEEFDTNVTSGKYSKASGIRKYIFKIGDIEHCFHKYSHSYKFTNQDTKYNKKRDAYNVGDLISMHHTSSGSLIRISVDERAKVQAENNFSIHLITHIKHKVKSNSEIIKYHPREINLDDYHIKDCFYFHIGEALISVSEDCFSKYPAQTPVKILKDEDGKLTKHIFVQNANDRWDELELA